MYFLRLIDSAGLRSFLLVSLATSVFLGACSEKEFDPNDAGKSFVIARESYDDGNYDMALNRLGEFKARFPYSHFATDAELMIADCHYELSQFAESTAAYEQFIKLHPKHPKRDYARFRIGESYWADAPTAVNREQELTQRAVGAYEVLIKDHPESSYVAEARARVETGHRRMADAEAFRAHFYCKQEIWHACAWRYIRLIESVPARYGDLVKQATKEAADAFEHMAEEWREEDSDKNLYYRSMSPDALRKKASELRARLKRF